MATIAQILMAQGQEAAESRRRRAGAWIPLVQHLASLPNQVMADRAAEREAQEAGFDRAQQRDVRGVQIAKGVQELEAAEATAEQKRQMNEILRSPGVMDPESQRMNVSRAHEIAAEKGYLDIADDILTLGQQHNAAIEKGLRETTLFEQEQTDRRQATNKQGVQRMIGESIAGRGGEPISPAEAQTYQGMAFQEGIELPKGVLPEPDKPFTYGSLEKVTVNGRSTLARTRSDGALVDLKGNVIKNAEPEPPVGPQSSYQWATDPATGKVRRMSEEEIRAAGAEQPPTADMRNKAEGRRFVARSIDAIQNLSTRIIQRVGPAQRADAVKRGAEAVFGSDPEFRTYQDARRAMAGNLAVAQQGSRPSDADITAIWLPLVPDAYRDTAESARMKWDLIRTMSLPAAAGGATDQPPAGADPLGIRVP